MKNIFTLFIFLVSLLSNSQVQLLQDNFETSGNQLSWYGDDCGMDNNFNNPFLNGINNSSKVLKYTDLGGQYANIGFTALGNFNLTTNHTFSIKIYVPSSGITGNQPNQVSLKLQNSDINAPFSTQCSIVKPIILNQWQVITFNFATDNYINFDPNVPNPLLRTDFNRVLLQVNGENNNNLVTAYIDDFNYNGSITIANNNFDNLVWSDEFDGTGAINTTKWFHQTQLPNGTSWYSNEQQHYTNRIDNSYVSNGTLKILAKKEIYTNQGQTKQYTSARLNSKFSFKYGRVEVRAKLPTGVGTWPAIWMLGKNIIEPGGYWTNTFGTVNWPSCGEVDIMEHWGNNQNVVSSAFHTPQTYTSNFLNFHEQTINTVSSQFHTYTLDWTNEKLTFKVDNIVHYVYYPLVKNASTWPFDQEFYLLLNVAMQPPIATNFTQSAMEIDYVRVYQQSTLSADTFEIKKEVVLYPNPTNDKITIQVPEEWMGSYANTLHSFRPRNKNGSNLSKANHLGHDRI